MAHTNEKAVAGGSDTAQDTAHAADNTKSLDFVAVLATYGPSLTKIYRSDGKTDAYDDAASFQCKEIAVTDLSGLSRLLTKLESRTQNCIIRGKYVGDDRADPGKLEGSIARTNSNFDDCPHHWFMVDIDKYEPDFDDPVNDPVNAIRDYLDRLMPPCFKDVSFHWQLSSSAGMPGKTHILKAHVWFWSETPYTSAQMYAWAKQVGIWIDKAVYRRVQIHYTANPVFEAGRDDPVPVRSGFYQGARDTVALKIDADVLESARQTGSGVGGADKELKDPSLKENIIGAFHQAFDAHTVLMEHLEGMFEPGVNDRRWTWLDGGGTPEGVWVHSDGMHVGATHNTWPAELEGAPNLWDLVRVFKFGHLDHSEDDFAQLDIDEMELHERPSHKAMVAWAKELPEVAEKLAEIERENAERRETHMQSLLQLIASAESQSLLHTEVLGKLKTALGEDDLLPYQKAEIEAAYCKRAQALSPNKAKMSPKQIKEAFAPEEAETARACDLELSLGRQVLLDWFDGGKHLMRFGKCWWLYRGGVWRVTEDEYVQNKVFRTLRNLINGHNKEALRLTSFLRESDRVAWFDNLVSAVYRNLVRECAKQDGASDPLNLRGHCSESVINCLNGELWIDAEGGLEFVDHDPAHRLTHQLAAEYDPSAQCPRFMEALALVFCRCREPEEVIRHWLELMGMLIQPRRIAALWLMMKGPGANGKTFLVEMIEALLGPDSCVKGSIAEVTQDRHFTASLVGKLVFIDDDVEKGIKLPDGWLKKLSEEKQLTANPKNAGTFAFTNRAVMVMLTNHWPSTSDISEGMRRRAQVFETGYVIPEERRDPNLKRAIVEAELPGILNLLIQGLQRALKRGRFAAPTEVRDAGERWMKAANKTRSFFVSMLRKKPGAPAVKTKQLYELYLSWHQDEPSARPIGKTAFEDELREWAGEAIFDRAGQHHIKGIVPCQFERTDPAAEGDYGEARAEERLEEIINAVRGNFTAEDDFQ